MAPFGRCTLQCHRINFLRHSGVCASARLAARGVAARRLGRSLFPQTAAGTNLDGERLAAEEFDRLYGAETPSTEDENLNLASVAGPNWRHVHRSRLGKGEGPFPRGQSRLPTDRRSRILAPPARGRAREHRPVFQSPAPLRPDRDLVRQRGPCRRLSFSGVSREGALVRGVRERPHRIRPASRGIGQGVGLATLRGRAGVSNSASRSGD